MDWKFWTPLAINVIGVGLMYWQGQMMKQQIEGLPSPRSAQRIPREKKLVKRLYVPVVLMVVLVLLSWLPYVLRGASSGNVIPTMLVAWGGTPTGCSSVIDTSGIAEAAEKYRLFVACTIADPTVDGLENQQFAISRPFHISGGVVPIGVTYNPSSAIAAAAKPGTATQINIILLPSDRDGSDVRKLADVLRDGGHILVPGAKKSF